MRDVEELIERIGRLVRRREFLRRVGVDEGELRPFDVEIERLRWRLAGAVRNAVDEREAA
jgi:hypothetical protein